MGHIVDIRARDPASVHLYVIRKDCAHDRTVSWMYTSVKQLKEYGIAKV
jgi:hypothetical protein